MKIVTSFNGLGWTAVTDNYDGGDRDYDRRSNHPIGFGLTEQEAIEDLKEQLAEAQ